MLKKYFLFTDIVEIHEDSDTDSDFDSRIDAVINEIPVVDEQILAETAETVLSANTNR